MDKFLDKKREIEVSKDLQNTNKDDLLVSYDFNSLYHSDQIDIKTAWPIIETIYPFRKCMSESICNLFKSGRWNEVKRWAFLTVKYHNSENLVFNNFL